MSSKVLDLKVARLKSDLLAAIQLHLEYYRPEDVSLAQLRHDLSQQVYALAMFCDLVIELNTVPDVQMGRRGHLRSLTKATRGELLDLLAELRQLVNQRWFTAARLRCAALIRAGFVGLPKQRKRTVSEMLADAGADPEIVASAKAVEEAVEIAKSAQQVEPQSGG